VNKALLFFFEKRRGGEREREREREGERGRRARRNGETTEDNVMW